MSWTQLLFVSTVGVSRGGFTLKGGIDSVRSWLRACRREPEWRDTNLFFERLQDELIQKTDYKEVPDPILLQMFLKNEYYFSPAFLLFFSCFEKCFN